MEGPRPVKTSELPHLLEFLQKTLRPQHSWPISAEYPSTFTETNLDNLQVISDGEAILSHAALRTILIKTPLGIFKVATIGSVVTDPAHRNRGLSQSIIKSCLDRGLAEGCDFAILWTNIYDYYRKLGFELGGTEVSFTLQQPLQLPGSPFKIVNSSQVSAEAIYRLYSSHTVGTLRTAADIQRSLNIPNSQVYTAWDADNNLKAYAVEGKGADLQGYIHEWGGSTSALISLFNSIHLQTGRPLTVITPSHSKNLINQLEQQGLKPNQGFLGMIKLLDERHLFFKIIRQARSQGFEDLVLEKRGGVFYMGLKDQLFRTDSESDIIRLIFGPSKAHEIHSFNEKTLKVFEKIFPLSMWIWGWDSI